MKVSPITSKVCSKSAPGKMMAAPQKKRANFTNIGSKSCGCDK